MRSFFWALSKTVLQKRDSLAEVFNLFCDVSYHGCIVYKKRGPGKALVMYLVGAGGFEPPPSAVDNHRVLPVELRPDFIELVPGVGLEPTISP